MSHDTFGLEQSNSSSAQSSNTKPVYSSMSSLSPVIIYVSIKGEVLVQKSCFHTLLCCIDYNCCINVEGKMISWANVNWHGKPLFAAFKSCSTRAFVTYFLVFSLSFFLHNCSKRLYLLTSSIVCNFFLVNFYDIFIFLWDTFGTGVFGSASIIQFYAHDNLMFGFVMISNIFLND